METHPSPDQARAALSQAARAEQAVRYPPLPIWFFITMALVLSGYFLIQLLPPSDTAKAAVALVIIALVPAVRFWIYRKGVAWTSGRLRDLLPFTALLLGLYIACAIIAAATGGWWVWIPGAAVAGTVVLITGQRYRREFGSHGS